MPEAVNLEESGVERVKPEDLRKQVGQYTVLWRKRRKMVARIESVDTDDKRIIYEIVSGPDKGDRIRSRYDTSQTVYLCGEKQLMLGLLFANS